MVRFRAKAVGCVVWSGDACEGDLPITSTRRRSALFPLNFITQRLAIDRVNECRARKCAYFSRLSLVEPIKAGATKSASYSSHTFIRIIASCLWNVSAVLTIAPGAGPALALPEVPAVHNIKHARRVMERAKTDGWGARFGFPRAGIDSQFWLRRSGSSSIRCSA